MSNSNKKQTRKQKDRETNEEEDVEMEVVDPGSKTYSRTHSRQSSSSSVATDELPGVSTPVKGKKRKTVEEEILEVEKPFEERIGTSLKEIYDERSRLEEFLFNESNKITRSAIKLVLEKWGILESRLQREIMEKEILREKCKVLENTNVRSYAQVASIEGRLAREVITVKGKEKVIRKKPSGEVIIIRPEKEEDKRNNDEIKREVLDKLSSVRSKLKVKNIRQSRKKGLVVEVNSNADIEVFKSCKLDKIGLKIDKPKRLNPSIMIYDVEKEYKIEELKEEFVEKNFDVLEKDEIEILKDNVVFAHSFKTKDEKKVNWVVQIPGKFYERLLDRGRVYIMWRSYRIKEFINVIRCYKCQGYGHIAATCKEEDQLCGVCGKKGHVKSKCVNMESPKCVNCSRAKRKDLNHVAHSVDCLEYKKQIDIYKNKMGLKIGQINAQRSAVAAASLELIMKEMSLDVLCVQEPYCYKKKVRGYTAQGLRIVQPEACEYSWVAAVINDEKVEVLQGINDGNEHVMCFKIMTETVDLYVINVYFQYSIPLETILKKVEEILDTISGHNVILTMDANAKSTAWFSKETDERGKILEEFIIAKNLYIVNRPGNLSTFCSSSSESNIDVTIVGEMILNKIKSWKVHSACTSSDHNLIVFEIEDGQMVRKFWKEDNKYNLKKANWEEFYDNVDKEFNEDVIAQMESLTPDKAVRKFNKLLNLCCSRSIPRKKTGQKMVPWWNKELEELRRKVNGAKKQLLRVRKLGFSDLVEEYGLKYRRERNRYVAAIRKRKRTSWENFVTVEGNNDPWGIVYKIIREKFNRSTYLNSLILADGTKTKDVESTVDQLIKKCVPTEDQRCNSDEHLKIKETIINYKNANMESEIGLEEIDNAIKKFKKNKAPGKDGFSIEIIKALWKCRPAVIYKLLNSCFIKEIFPREWKVANLKIILKDQDRDKSLVGSYRPIALLPVFGKLYERIIVNRINESYTEKGLASNKQFGFKKGFGVDDAFISLKSAVCYTESKYVVVIFVDIAGAFDNLWWPAVLNRLLAAECSSKLVNIVKNYFKNRKVGVYTKLGKTEAKMNKGCPQGSIIGPLAWTWCMDVFLKKVEVEICEDDVEVLAYADDLACVVKGNSRVQVEMNIKRLLNLLDEWCKLHKLEVSGEKTHAMLMKGKFNRERMPVVKINDVKIKYVDKIKYLGVIIDQRMKFVEHAKYVRNKIIKLVMTLRRVTREKWGLRACVQKIMYKAVALPMIKYGAVMWYDQTQSVLVKRHLMATQRALLLLITRACRTVSTVAMQVIAGTMPIDLEVVEQAAISRIKRNMSTSIAWAGYSYRERAIEEHKSILVNEIKNLKEKMILEWQNKWNRETRGRTTYNFIKNVIFAQDNCWFQPGRLCVYMLTGYGPIKSSLYSRGCVENSICPVCGNQEETVDHMLYQCDEYQSFRYPLLRNEEGNKEELIQQQDNFKKFQELTVQIFERRKTLVAIAESRGPASSGQGR